MDWCLQDKRRADYNCVGARHITVTYDFEDGRVTTPVPVHSKRIRRLNVGMFTLNWALFAGILCAMLSPDSAVLLTVGQLALGVMCVPLAFIYLMRVVKAIASMYGE